ncbi:MAG: S1 RNA-binding domain-containing protein [Oscillospiraceae bacterium]|jgi:S1 RNA binding domain protein|nr:S1 RNA-binding domain-containing protein [Oscillospiraceae bacterium]
MALEVGQIIEGKITGITKFGVFVDVGDGKTGMVHISEVAQTYVSEIKDHVQEGQAVKVKVLAVNDDGKISLSIKRAEELKPRSPRPQGERSFGPRKSAGPLTFEDMMSKFKQSSEDKFSDLKRKNPDAKRVKKGH